MAGNPTEKRDPSSSVDNTVHDYDISPSPALTGYPSGSSIAGGTTTRYHLYIWPPSLKSFYYHPYTQVVLLGFVCFACPGLFNALNGLGAGGQVDGTTSANANSTLYATFAVAASFAGSVSLYLLTLPHSLFPSSSVNNILGPRMTLFLGSSGYAIYIGSYL